MGIEYRRSDHKKNGYTGFVTIKKCEAIIIKSNSGYHEVVVGPKTVSLLFANIQFLDRFIAGTTQYFIVTYIDGRREHIDGPGELFMNPNLHSNIVVANAYGLVTEFDCILVKKNKNNEESAIVVKGPKLYFPTVSEEIVEFCWHGSDENSDFVKEDCDRFKILKLDKKQWKIDVPFVLGKESGILKLTLSFEIINVELMLQQTLNLTGALYEALLIDLKNFTSNFQIFDSHVYPMSVLFSTLDAFPTLMHRSKGLGTKFSSVFFRGFSVGNTIEQSSGADLFNDSSRNFLSKDESSRQLRQSMSQQLHENSLRVLSNLHDHLAVLDAELTTKRAVFR